MKLPSYAKPRKEWQRSEADLKNQRQTRLIKQRKQNEKSHSDYSDRA